MMDFMVDHELYEGVLWAVILAISLVFVFYAYLLHRLARVAHNRRWKDGFHCAAATSLIFGILRLVVAFYYYDDPTARLSIPVTAAVSWFLIAIVGYAVVRWVEEAAERIALSREGAQLMNDVIDEAIDPLLRGENADPTRLEQLRARQNALIAGAR